MVKLSQSFAMQGYPRLMKTWMYIGTIVAGALFWFLSDPMPQLLAYHHFADQRSLFGIPHTVNVLSNVVFCLAGFWGYNSIAKRVARLSRIDITYLMFFGGVFFTGLGSAYYHWSPDNTTLVWDRLPMTVAFMAFTSLVVSERCSDPLGYRLLPWLLVLGVLSVLYWAWMDDLRPYLVIQFGPILILPLLIWRFSGPGTCWLWLIIVFYLAAKLLELSDHQVLQWTEGLVSGHTLKHIVAAGAALIMVKKVSEPKRHSRPPKPVKHHVATCTHLGLLQVCRPSTEDTSWKS